MIKLKPKEGIPSPIARVSWSDLPYVCLLFPGNNRYVKLGNTWCYRLDSNHLVKTKDWFCNDNPVFSSNDFVRPLSASNIKVIPKLHDPRGIKADQLNMIKGDVLYRADTFEVFVVVDGNQILQIGTFASGKFQFAGLEDAIKPIFGPCLMYAEIEIEY